MSSGDLSDAALAAKAWPFEEARKVVARLERRAAKGESVKEVLFETGYGPSGLPHIGTFGEVARTTWVRRAFEMMRPIAEKNRIELMEERAPQDTVVCCDSEAVSQILSNLMENAIKYTPEGGKISVGAQAQGSMVEFFVRDTGIGIPEEDLPRLFREVIGRLEHYNSPDAQALRIAFARDNTYGNQVRRIEELLETIR